jgi:hypothetical protein
MYVCACVCECVYVYVCACVCVCVCVCARARGDQFKTVLVYHLYELLDVADLDLNNQGFGFRV